MTDRCSTGCPWTGETPDDETESAPVSGGACETIETYSQACETPAKAVTDRGRGHDEMFEGNAS